MGRLIVIEGLDASGKGTQSAILERRLKESGIPCRLISLPNYDDDSSALVKMYLAGQFGTSPSDVNAYAASAFYAVDRYAGYKKDWGRPYENGTLIIANRYATANVAHQMPKLPAGDRDAYLQWLFDFEYNKMGIPEPDLVIFLDMPVEVSQRLMLKRYQNDETKKDVHERDTAYLNDCRVASLYAAQRCGWKVIACSSGQEPRSVDEIADDVYAAVTEKFPDLKTD